MKNSKSDQAHTVILSALFVLLGWFGNRFFEGNLLVDSCLFGFCTNPLEAFIVSSVSLLILLICL
jgi:hypothetical protein